MEEKIQKAKLLGSTIDVWIKVAGVVIMIIGYSFITYFQIKSNEEDNIRQDLQFKEITDMFGREFEIQAERSDKRYTRAMGEAGELHEHDHKLEKKDAEQDKLILDLYKEIWYIKGKLDEQKN